MLAVFIVSVSKALIDRHVLIRLIIQAIPENTNRERKTIFEESLSIQTPLCGWQIVELVRYKGAFSLVRFVSQVSALLDNTLWYIVVLFQNSVEGRGIVVNPLLVLVVELVSDQLAVDLDPQVAGEGDGEDKPQT